MNLSVYQHNQNILQVSNKWTIFFLPPFFSQWCCKINLLVCHTLVHPLWFWFSTSKQARKREVGKTRSNFQHLLLRTITMEMIICRPISYIHQKSINFTISVARPWDAAVVCRKGRRGWNVIAVWNHPKFGCFLETRKRKLNGVWIQSKRIHFTLKTNPSWREWGGTPTDGIQETITMIFVLYNRNRRSWGTELNMVSIGSEVRYCCEMLLL